jgi:hypothetical protein
MRKILIIIIIVFLVSVCKKEKINDENVTIFKTEDNTQDNSAIISDFDESVYRLDYYQVVLYSKNIISKEKSLPEEKLDSFLDEQYDIKYIDTKNNITKIIVTDKFSNTRIIPIVLDETIEKDIKDDIIKKTTNYRCFVLHRVFGSHWKLFYINEFNKDTNDLDEVVIKEYEYQNIWFPAEFKALITPNFFIIKHWDLSGEEYTLINRETGEYSIIDTDSRSKH